MALSCFGEIMASIAPNCDSPLAGGYTGRGVLIPADAITAVTSSTTNPRILEAITASTVIGIENAVVTPFDGSSTASSADDGKMSFGKTIAFRIPLRGAATSKDIIEPLAYSTTGYVAIVEKKDKVGDGSFEIIGYNQGLKVNADGIQRNENENGGDVSVTMSCTEGWFEATLFKTDYATSKGIFEALLTEAL